MGAMAFLSVALGISEVKSWRPGFGPISEAYTVRRFGGYALLFSHAYCRHPIPVLFYSGERIFVRTFGVPR